MVVKTNVEEYLVEFQDLLKLFEFDGSESELIHEEKEENNTFDEKFILKDSDEKEFDFKFSLDASFSPLYKKSYRKRMVKNYLYKIISKEFNINLPWGSLTGIRPTKFSRDLISYGEAKEHIIPEILSRDYYVSREKARLVGQILKNQKGIIRNDNLIDLYINIPICPSRCLYCSFISK